MVTNMELEESVIESTFAFSRFASLMLVLAIVFIVISLININKKEKNKSIIGDFRNLSFSGNCIFYTRSFFWY